MPRENDERRSRLDARFFLLGACRSAEQGSCRLVSIAMDRNVLRALGESKRVCRRNTVDLLAKATAAALCGLRR